MTELPLSQLENGQRAYIRTISGDDRWLREIGFMEGDEVIIQHRGMTGDPLAIQINKHRLIAMRKKDATRIGVELA